MYSLITNMMKYSNITPELLELKKELKNDYNQMLYWDYYLYVKENPILKWDNKTSILFGRKDDLTSIDTINKFSDLFNCKLEIIENAEHFFHTDEQLKSYQQWLIKTI